MMLRPIIVTSKDTVYFPFVTRLFALGGVAGIDKYSTASALLVSTHLRSWKTPQRLEWVRISLLAGLHIYTVLGIYNRYMYCTLKKRSIPPGAVYTEQAIRKPYNLGK